MGQAKQRGTFEKRQAQAIARKEVEEAERKRKMEEELAALTPEERQKRMEAVASTGLASALGKRRINMGGRRRR